MPRNKVDMSKSSFDRSAVTALLNKSDDSVKKGNVRTMASQKGKKTQRINFVFRPDIHENLKKLARFNGTSMNDYVQSLIEANIKLNKQIINVMDDNDRQNNE
ncbi:MAG: hypothetical protein ACOYB8_07595 [Eubacteriaceae bacterium]